MVRRETGGILETQLYMSGMRREAAKTFLSWQFVSSFSLEEENTGSSHFTERTAHIDTVAMFYPDF